jgi:DNA-binding NtrC family response regulator
MRSVALRLLGFHDMSEDVRPVVAMTSVLLVEDNVTLLDSLNSFFRENGYETFTAGSNREAWQVIRASQPAVCVLDVNLPDGSGLDLLKRISAAYPGMRVVIMTALPLENLRPRYARPNLAGWLTKPVSPEQLLEAVERAANSELH